MAMQLGASLPVGDIGLPDSESLTYERYFGLRNKPFSLSPDPKFFFSNPSRREARRFGRSSLSRNG